LEDGRKDLAVAKEEGRLLVGRGKGLWPSFPGTSKKENAKGGTSGPKRDIPIDCKGERGSEFGEVAGGRYRLALPGVLGADKGRLRIGFVLRDIRKEAGTSTSDMALRREKGILLVRQSFIGSETSGIEPINEETGPMRRSSTLRRGERELSGCDLSYASLGA